MKCTLISQDVFVIRGISMIRPLIKSVTAELQHSIMKSDFLAERWLHADQQHRCCKIDERLEDILDIGL